MLSPLLYHDWIITFIPFSCELTSNWTKLCFLVRIRLFGSARMTMLSKLWRTRFQLRASVARHSFANQRRAIGMSADVVWLLSGCSKEGNKIILSFFLLKARFIPKKTHTCEAYFICVNHDILLCHQSENVFTQVKSNKLGEHSGLETTNMLWFGEQLLSLICECLQTLIC
jgi:hypothetical protein